MVFRMFPVIVLVVIRQTPVVMVFLVMILLSNIVVTMDVGQCALMTNDVLVKLMKSPMSA